MTTVNDEAMPEKGPGEVLHDELRAWGYAAGAWDQQPEKYRVDMTASATRLGVPSSGSMTREEALTMLAGYSEVIPELKGMRQRFPEGGSAAKAMRWLGYAQGVCSALGYFSLDALKEHSRLRLDVRIAPPHMRACQPAPAPWQGAEDVVGFFHDLLRKGWPVMMRAPGERGERASTAARFQQLFAEGLRPALLAEVEVQVEDPSEAAYLRTLVGHVRLAVRGMFLRPAQHPRQVGAAPITAARLAEGARVATPQGAEVVVGGEGDSVYTESPDGTPHVWPGDVVVEVRDLDEAVDHPAHYGGADDPYEAIKVIEAWGLGFNLGNALKYLSRAGRKPGEARRKDLAKAAWYLARDLAHEEASLVRHVAHEPPPPPAAPPPASPQVELRPFHVAPGDVVVELRGTMSPSMTVEKVYADGAGVVVAETCWFIGSALRRGTCEIDRLAPASDVAKWARFVVLERDMLKAEARLEGPYHPHQTHERVREDLEAVREARRAFLEGRAVVIAGTTTDRHGKAWSTSMPCVTPDDFCDHWRSGLGFRVTPA